MAFQLRIETITGNALLNDTLIARDFPIPSPGDIVFVNERSYMVKWREYYYEELGTINEICAIVLYCDPDYELVK